MSAITKKATTYGGTRRIKPVTGSLAPSMRFVARKLSSPFITTSRELESSSAIPWNEIIPPSVMMNGSMRVLEMMNPMMVSRTIADARYHHHGHADRDNAWHGDLLKDVHDVDWTDESWKP